MKRCQLRAIEPPRNRGDLAATVLAVDGPPFVEADAKPLGNDRLEQVKRAAFVGDDVAGITDRTERILAQGRRGHGEGRTLQAKYFKTGVSFKLAFQTCVL